jgi:hypothetical protein
LQRQVKVRDCFALNEDPLAETEIACHEMTPCNIDAKIGKRGRHSVVGLMDVDVDQADWGRGDSNEYLEGSTRDRGSA